MELRGALRRKTQEIVQDQREKSAQRKQEADKYKTRERESYSKELARLKEKKAHDDGLAKARKQMSQSAGGFFQIAKPQPKTTPKKRTKARVQYVVVKPTKRKKKATRKSTSVTAPAYKLYSTQW